MGCGPARVELDALEVVIGEADDACPEAPPQPENRLVHKHVVRHRLALTGEGQRALSSLLGFESAVASLIFFFGWFMKRNLSGKSVGGAGATVFSSPFLYSSVYVKLRHW